MLKKNKCSVSEEDGKTIEFDFLIDGEFLRTSLQDHMQQREISTVSIPNRGVFKQTKQIIEY